MGLLFVYSGSVFEPYTWTFLIHGVDQAEAKTELFREPFSLETLVHFAVQPFLCPYPRLDSAETGMVAGLVE